MTDGATGASRRTPATPSAPATGRATSAGTARYRERHAATRPGTAWRTLGQTGLAVGAIGFGSYRVAIDVTEHEASLRQALLDGMNLIDTSSNYSDGDSESMIGKVLAAQFVAGTLQRDEVVVVSKVGYVQGRNMAIVRERAAAGTAFPDMVQYANGCWHCLHPDFLADQLARTLTRLNLATVDVYLLHNPEYFLSDAKRRGGNNRAATRAEYDRRLRQAFAWLETQVAAGRIGCYGVSSNTFPAAASDPEFTSLERVLELAREVGGAAHGLRVIQFPANLYETGALTERNQRGASLTVADLVRETGLATLINRPLNASQGRGMVRLASFPGGDREAAAAAFHRHHTTLVDLRRRFEAEVVPVLFADATTLEPAAAKDAQLMARVFQLIDQLTDGLSLFDSWMHWDQARRQVVEPTVAECLDRLDQRYLDQQVWITWSYDCRQTAIPLLAALDTWYSSQAAEASLAVVRQLERAAPDLATTPGLAQQALRVLASVPEFTIILLGMRRPAYVDDASAVLRAPPIAAAAGVIASLRP